MSREPGYYWTRSRNPEYPKASIAEWSSELWHHPGVSATSQDHEVEVLSGPVMLEPQLGRKVETPASPDAAQLDQIENPAPGRTYVVRFTCPEFTSLCPVTGQPDFAHIVIDYIPRNWLIESKSLKLYLAAFRNHGAYHEACTMEIAHRVRVALNPLWLRIGAYWFPRGGIPIDVFWQTAVPPEHVWIPPQEVAPYRGRG